MNEVIGLEEQVEHMRKYVQVTDEVALKEMISYTGYFRLRQYAVYLLSKSQNIKPSQEILLSLYNFDEGLRKLIYEYTQYAEIQFKTYVCDAVCFKTNDACFYLKEEYYTPSKGSLDKAKKQQNTTQFKKSILKSLINKEQTLRKKAKNYPELKEFQGNGEKAGYPLPCWVAFFYFDFGMITTIYGYLRNDLQKYILVHNYSKKRYKKELTKEMDTWLAGIRNIRNISAHHNRLVGKSSSVVLPIAGEEDLLLKQTDLFSRLYALKKVLNQKDGLRLQAELYQFLEKSEFDLYGLGILPEDWYERYSQITFL